MQQAAGRGWCPEDAAGSILACRDVLWHGQSQQGHPHLLSPVPPAACRPPGSWCSPTRRALCCVQGCCWLPAIPPFFVGIFGLLALPPWSCPSVLQHNSLKKLLKATLAAETKPQLLVSESPESPPAPPGSCLPSTLSHVGAPQQPRGARCSPRAQAGGVLLAGGLQGRWDMGRWARREHMTSC